MNEKKMTQEQARKILCEYLDLDKEEHSEFLDAIRTLIQPQAEIQCGHSTEEIEKSFMEDVEAVKEQLPNGDLISREELLKAIDTWDKFGCNADTKLVPYQDHYIPYIHYDDVVKCIKGMPSVNPAPCEDAISRQAVLDLAITIETDDYSDNQILDVVEVDDIKALPSVKPQESSRDMKEIEEVINCDADAETKCKMISNILTAKPHYFEEQEPKTGHWIEHPEIKTSTPKYLMFYECSECGDKQCFCKSDIHKKHFCSNCGCRMVEPQESEG